MPDDVGKLEENNENVIEIINNNQEEKNKNENNPINNLNANNNNNNNLNPPKENNNNLNYGGDEDDGDLKDNNKIDSANIVGSDNKNPDDEKPRIIKVDVAYGKKNPGMNEDSNAEPAKITIIAIHVDEKTFQEALKDPKIQQALKEMGVKVEKDADGGGYKLTTLGWAGIGHGTLGLGFGQVALSSKKLVDVTTMITKKCAEIEQKNDPKHRPVKVEFSGAFENLGTDAEKNDAKKFIESLKEKQEKLEDNDPKNIKKNKEVIDKQSKKLFGDPESTDEHTRNGWLKKLEGDISVEELANLKKEILSELKKTNQPKITEHAGIEAKEADKYFNKIMGIALDSTSMQQNLPSALRFTPPKENLAPDGGFKAKNVEMGRLEYYWQLQQLSQSNKNLFDPKSKQYKKSNDKTKTAVADLGKLFRVAGMLKSLGTNEGHGKYANNVLERMRASLKVCCNNLGSSKDDVKKKLTQYQHKLNYCDGGKIKGWVDFFKGIMEKKWSQGGESVKKKELGKLFNFGDNKAPRKVNVERFLEDFSATKSKSNSMKI